MKQLLLQLLALFSVLTLSAQSPRPKMIRVEGGTRILGGGYQFEVKDYYMVMLGGDKQYAAMNDGQIVIGEVPAPNNPQRQVTVHRFLMSETEVTNFQYREFLIDSLLEPAEAVKLRADLKASAKEGMEKAYSLWKPLVQKASAAGLLPDTACWSRDFSHSYNEPLVRNYFWHKAFNEYPVMGVSWDQAKAYCYWLTEEVNSELLRKDPTSLVQPGFRLPTEAEWEYAALPKATGTPDNPTKHLYPWPGSYLTDDKGQYRANIKTQPGDYIGDNYEYTNPVKAFPPNENGLYGMAGNVSEWCDDSFIFNTYEKMSEVNPSVIQPGGMLFAAEESSLAPETRVVKGGSWADFCYGAMVGSRMPFPQAQGSSRVGFRVAQIVLGSPF